MKHASTCSAFANKRPRPFTAHAESNATASSPQVRILSALVLPCIAAGALLSAPLAHSHIPTTEILSSAVERPAQTAGFLTSRSFSKQDNARPVLTVPEKVADVSMHMQTAKQAIDDAQFEMALADYEYIVRSYPDLAITEYARLGRALLLYQVGRVSDALVQLQEEEVAVRGYPEVHAALAALLYAERPQQALRAEQEWDLATSFDRRYSNLEWVKSQKHWPPRALDALDRFLTLT